MEPHVLPLNTTPARLRSHSGDSPAAPNQLGLLLWSLHLAVTHERVIFVSSWHTHSLSLPTLSFTSLFRSSCNSHQPRLPAKLLTSISPSYLAFYPFQTRSLSSVRYYVTCFSGNNVGGGWSKVWRREFYIRFRVSHGLAWNGDARREERPTVSISRPIYKLWTNDNLVPGHILH